VLEKYAKDKWFQTAILSSGTGISMEFMHYLVAHQSFDHSDKTAFLTTFAHAIAARNEPGELIDLLTLSAQLDKKYQAAVSKALPQA